MCVDRLASNATAAAAAKASQDRAYLAIVITNGAELPG
jgi:hypothetical protein